ncbi:MAG: dipicolinate synthase subunit B [Lachnospiraceae bacterium]|nr:dipicolinate synthase subunit B [Lachnospiraceae bacterium]
MKKRSELTIGWAITGSFCTFAKVKEQIRALQKQEVNMIPIFSFNAAETDSRFGRAEDFVREIEQITGKKGIYTIPEAEPIGPSSLLDILVIAPCTGNTLAKLCHGITDTPVLMAAKAHLRGEKPVVLSVASNDSLGMNFKNIGLLMNTKNIYFVPFGQDDCVKKPASMVAHVELLGDTINAALEGKQLQPVIREYLQT